jgi:transposase
MIPLSPATRVFVVTGATDMRKGFDGLYGIVANRLGL